MISYLIGKPIVEKDSLTIITGGVGYAVRVNDKVMREAQQKTELELHIYTHVREDLIELYGFETRHEREVFLLLIDVSGVGPKTALSILNYGAQQIIDAVQEADVSVFSAVPRVGKKLAQKIIIDLRTKLGSLKELDLNPASPKHEEVSLALQSLGFDEKSIYQTLRVVDIENMTTAEAIKRSLRELQK